MRIRDITVGSDSPLLLISGLNVIESLDAALACADGVAAVAERHGLPAVFKASYDKANRSSQNSFRGVGLDAGLRILEQVKTASGLPVTTDVHEPGQAKMVAEVVELLQIPAFLSRQTDLVKACAETGLPINIKKGQFMAPDDVVLAVDKARGFGAAGVMVTERGTSFGYHDLIVDMRGLLEMRAAAPVAFDATHAVQHPGAGEGASSGDRSYVAPLARAAAALGIDALFVETHPDPERAPCDPACQIRLADLDALLDDVVAIREALDRPRG
ncbi:MAG TPA: 3-deoxy-8-phosphooctulonate synthase [Myxococcota bacterium]|nr:3-deoxy-8-phosphooctulonate synthase [Myxococcota bacterium]